MVPVKSFKDHGCLLFMNIADCVMMAKEWTMKEFEIIVVSRDIVSDVAMRRDNKIRYQSIFDNIEFITSIIPANGMIDSVYSRDINADERFFTEYDSQLVGDDAFTDLTCLVDMVVNDNVPTIIVASALDFKLKSIDYLRKFIEKWFKIKTYDLDDILDPDVNILDKGDEEEIKRLIVEYKKDLTSNNNPDEFFNYLTESLIDKYRAVLMRKTPEQLYQLASDKGIYVRKKGTKEEMVDTIIRKYQQ